MPTDWLTLNRFDPAYLPTMEHRLYFEGADAIRTITNYAVLLSLATAIATFGVIAGSAATVIGAMIVAPLMTPIMATTLGIVLGDGRRMTRSILIVGLSIVYVIVLSGVLSYPISPMVIGFGTNPEILGRVSPDLLALYAALASGAAGAFALSRKEIADALPGVAIAISLVPPLCVVGIAFFHARWLSGAGALILFLTNLFAIILAGGAIFWLSGVTPHRCRSQPGGAVSSGLGCDVAAQARSRRRAIMVAFVGMVVVAAVLGFNGYRTLEQHRDTSIAENVVEAWLGETKYILSDIALVYQPGDIAVNGPARARIVIAGLGDIPSIESLAADLSARLDYDVSVELRVVPQEIAFFPTIVGVPGSREAEEALEQLPQVVL